MSRHFSPDDRLKPSPGVCIHLICCLPSAPTSFWHISREPRTRRLGAVCGRVRKSGSGSSQPEGSAECRPPLFSPATRPAAIVGSSAPLFYTYEVSVRATRSSLNRRRRRRHPKKIWDTPCWSDSRKKLPEWQERGTAPVDVRVFHTNGHRSSPEPLKRSINPSASVPRHLT